MMNWLSPWGPAIFMVIAIWIGLIYNNKRLDDFKDLLRAEIGGSEARVRSGITSSEARMKAEITNSEARIRGDVAKLDARVARLEEPRMVR